MRVLVTGGFGLIGGRLAQHLAAGAGAEVVLGSRKRCGPPEWLPEAHVQTMDWGSATALAAACRGADVVVHAAGMNAEDSARDPAAALEFNGDATGRLAEAAKRRGVRRFLYISTAHVYGRPLQGTISEGTTPAPAHPYASSHLAGERNARSAAGNGLDVVVTRLSNAFGAPAHPETDCWSLLVHDLCRQAATSDSLQLRTAGLQRRDFIPLADACRAIHHLISLDARRLGQGVFNLGGQWAPTVAEMAAIVADRCEAVLGREVKVVKPAPTDGEETLSLDYRTDALHATGFRSETEPAKEIDSLLKFCQSSFR